MFSPGDLPQQQLPPRIPNNYATERGPVNHGSIIQERIQAITEELNKFKEEKLLFKQMQGQLASCPPGSQQSLAAEVEAFRTYLRKK
mmetsp:Transcript_4023/g.6033  ORF Transcript_4023/g.6033 Transcript_4023/m.6033 type:complete len:87 (+) Transcript_4023:86-346(+)